jgi:hypothetical protein
MKAAARPAIKLKIRKWIVGKEYTSNSENYPVLVTIETNNGFIIARDVMPHDAEEIVRLHNLVIEAPTRKEVIQSMKVLQKFCAPRLWSDARTTILRAVTK